MLLVFTVIILNNVVATVVQALKEKPWSVMRSIASLPRPLSDEPRLDSTPGL